MHSGETDVILGLDLSLTATGWATISRYNVVDTTGTIKTDDKRPIPERRADA